VELEDRAAEDAEGLCPWRHVRQHVAQTADGPRVELRDTRLVDADLGANLLHGRFLIVVEPDHLLLAGRERRNRVLHPALGFFTLEGHVRTLGLRGDERRRQGGFVEMVVVGERRGGFDGVDADDRAAQALLVGTDLRSQVGQRRLATELAAQLLARGFELAALTADATRPGILAQRVDHRPPDAALGEGFELDTAPLVEAVRGIDETDDAVLDEVADIDRVGHRGRHAASKLFNEGNAVHDAGVVGGGWLGAHAGCCPPAHP